MVMSNDRVLIDRFLIRYIYRCRNDKQLDYFYRSLFTFSSNQNNSIKNNNNATTFDKIYSARYVNEVIALKSPDFFPV